MLLKRSDARYYPQQRRIGILHPLEGEQRRIFPRGYQVYVGPEEQDWESITEAPGVIFPHEVRPHPDRSGEQSLLIVPHAGEAYYSVGALTVSKATNGLGKKAVNADFYVPIDRLTPYPPLLSEEEEKVRPYLEHPLVVHNVVVDIRYDNPWEYSYELCA